MHVFMFLHVIHACMVSSFLPPPARNFEAVLCDDCAAAPCTGLKGGSVQNPIHALAQFVAELHAPNGTVAVDGFYE